MYKIVKMRSRRVQIRRRLRKEKVLEDEVRHKLNFGGVVSRLYTPYDVTRSEKNLQKGAIVNRYNRQSNDISRDINQKEE